MATETQQATIKIRRDTAANWTSNDPTPSEGELCLETDTKKIKIGDGSTDWSSLDYRYEQLEDVMFTDRICTAWVNFNGTGTVAIRDSYNVDSITDNGSGDYTINFTSNLSNANYSVSGIDTGGGTSGHTVQIHASSASTVPTLKTVSAVRIRTGSTAGTGDAYDISVQIFGGVA